jgi:hypothetical protein
VVSLPLPLASVQSLPQQLRCYSISTQALLQSCACNSGATAQHAALAVKATMRSLLVVLLLVRDNEHESIYFEAHIHSVD